MSDPTATPRILHFDAPCERLEAAPELPVRIGIVDDPGRAPEDRKRLGRRVADLLESLGVGAGVIALDAARDAQAPGRIDLAILRPASGPVGSEGAWLAAVRARVWVVDPMPDCSAAWDERATEVVAAGGPPAVLLPAGSDEEARWIFLEELIERLLHDAPLVRAVERASGSSGLAPRVILPSARRPGLDLGRLLERQRQEIAEVRATLRSWEMELAAAAGGAPAGAIDGLSGARKQAALELSAIAEACEEIDRDRDPPGWSRLSASIAELHALRDRLAVARRPGALGPGPG